MDTKAIIFTLDGVLSRPRFDTLLWHDEIPKLYAAQHGTSIEEAKTQCFAEYYRANHLDRGGGEGSLSYWFDRLDLDDDWKDVVKDMKDRVSVYPEVRTVLSMLDQDYRIGVVSTTNPQYLVTKIEVERIDEFIDEAVSTHELGEIAITPSVISSLCTKLGTAPADTIFVTADHEMAKRRPGDPAVTTYTIDRDRDTRDGTMLPSLTALSELLDPSSNDET